MEPGGGGSRCWNFPGVPLLYTRQIQAVYCGSAKAGRPWQAAVMVKTPASPNRQSRDPLRLFPHKLAMISIAQVRLKRATSVIAKDEQKECGWEQSEPLPILGRVITPLLLFITPVTHLLKGNFLRAPISPFITGRG